VTTTNCPTPGGKDPTPPGLPPEREPLPPDPPQVQTTHYGWDTVCQQVALVGGIHPQFLDGLFMNIISDHFVEADRIWDPSLHEVIWHRDPLKTKLSIFPVTLMVRDVSSDRPCIVVKRGAFRSSRIAIGDRDGVDGERFTRMVEGTHTFVAVGNSGANANALGWELFKFFEAICPVLRDQFGMDIVPDTAGELAVINDLGDQLGFPIGVSYRFLSSVMTETIDPAIKVFTATAKPQV
jgi:hypothetical protein